VGPFKISDLKQTEAVKQVLIENFKTAKLSGTVFAISTEEQP
jgi:hypothetical protein